jgi:hypothetical protein
MKYNAYDYLVCTQYRRVYTAITEQHHNSQRYQQLFAESGAVHLKKGIEHLNLND